MPATEMIVVITIAIAVVLISALGMRALNLRLLHRTVTVAIERDSPEVPTLIQWPGQRPRISYRLMAYVLLAIAAGILAPEGRAALVLTHGLGHSQSECAAILDLPLGTFKSLQARARARAVTLMGEQS